MPSAERLSSKFPVALEASLLGQLFIYLFYSVLLSANLDVMAGDLSKLNELLYEDPLIIT